MDKKQPDGTRQHDRINVNHEFRDLDHFIVEYVQNISRSGVFVKSDDPLPVGTLVNLKFTIIMDDLETIEGLGQVMRVVLPVGSETSGV